MYFSHGALIMTTLKEFLLNIIQNISYLVLVAGFMQRTCLIRSTSCFKFQAFLFDIPALDTYMYVPGAMSFCIVLFRQLPCISNGCCA